MTGEPARVDFYGSQYGNFASELYAEARRATYDEDIGQNGWLTAAEQDLMLEWLDLDPSARLLDVGCGSGGPTLRIAGAAGCRVDGIDVHPDAIEAARVAADARGLSTRAAFHRSEGGIELPFDDASYDAVMCIDAVNHLPDRPQVFAEWRRVLKQEGRLVFTDPTVVTGPLTHEEIAIRSSIGFFLFVPEGSDDEMLVEAGFEVTRREDRTQNMAEIAARWHAARAERAEALLETEGSRAFQDQQAFLDVCTRLASERRLSRIAYRAVKR